jgi:hypothetical protein
MTDSQWVLVGMLSVLAAIGHAPLETEFVFDPNSSTGEEMLHLSYGEELDTLIVCADDGNRLKIGSGAVEEGCMGVVLRPVAYVPPVVDRRM